MAHDNGDVPMSRIGSGTAWQPDDTPMHAVHANAGSWMLMAHGAGFLQFISESGDRGGDQVGSINWLMGMASRSAAGGQFGVRAMVSLEPWTIEGCGYPDLLATGENCDGGPIYDKQHPHDLIMELAAQYEHRLSHRLRVQVYGGPAGEPALGPVAFPHRASAAPNPVAPISHHWLDSTHVSYGVVTAALSGSRWQAEGSVFNGREPDEYRTDFDLAPLDSWSLRATVLPTARWAVQASGGHLREAEARDLARVDVDRLTASATYHRREGTRFWASLIAWGRNDVAGEGATQALLVETSVTSSQRHAWFARAETAGKSAHDLGLQSSQDTVASQDAVDVGKIQGGYTRYFRPASALTAGLGGAASIGVVPASLASVYGRRVNPGFIIFALLRLG